MIRSITPQLMFTGSAKEAMNFYVELFNGKILSQELYPHDHPDQAGQILQATFRIGTQELRCIDSQDVHSFTFTPSFSIFVNLETSEELKRVYEELQNAGEVLMPMDNYGFSDQFAWVNDRFGVSWQLNYKA